MDKQLLQHIKELFVKLEDQKNFKTHTPLFIYVETDLYYKFQICCYAQNLEPFEVIKRYMHSASSKQTVELIKEKLAGDKL